MKTDVKDKCAICGKIAEHARQCSFPALKGHKHSADHLQVVRDDKHKKFGVPIKPRGDK